MLTRILMAHKNMKVFKLASIYFGSNNIYSQNCSVTFFIFILQMKILENWEAEYFVQANILRKWHKMDLNPNSMVSEPVIFGVIKVEAQKHTDWLSSFSHRNPNWNTLYIQIVKNCTQLFFSINEYSLDIFPKH